MGWTTRLRSLTVSSPTLSSKIWTLKFAFETAADNPLTPSPTVAAGGGVSVDGQVYFTAPLADQYSFEMVMKDMLGDVVDTLQTSPQMLNNMKPVANGSVSLTDVQTWENIQFLGAGFDAWGLSLSNNSLPTSTLQPLMHGCSETTVLPT